MRLIKHMRRIYHIFLPMSRKIFYFSWEDETYSKRVIVQRDEKEEMGKGIGSQWTWKKEVKIK